MFFLLNCSDPLELSCLCVGSRVGSILLSSWFVLYMLLVPVFLSVLYIGFRRRRSRPRSAVSHADVFTFHMVAVEMLNAAGSVIFMYGLFSGASSARHFGAFTACLATNGQLLFHCLTCGERYLAVVRPVTYLRLKERGGARFRARAVALAWLLSVAMSLFVVYRFELQNMVHLSLMLGSVAWMAFSSVSVLSVLIRPGPGEVGGARKQFNQSKRSALCTITAILMVLLVRMVNSTVFQVLRMVVDVEACLWMTSTLWFNLPSSLVLPLLFLLRARAQDKTKN